MPILSFTIVNSPIEINSKVKNMLVFDGWGILNNN